MSDDCHYDYQVRSWALDVAVQSNKRGVKAEKIIGDAQKYYGFMFPDNGKVEKL